MLLKSCDRCKANFQADSEKTSLVAFCKEHFPIGGAYDRIVVSEADLCPACVKDVHTFIYGNDQKR